MEQQHDLDKLIELKKLENEKLRLEAIKSNNYNENNRGNFTGKYPNRIAINLILLIIISLDFYLMPWGKINTGVSYGSYHSSYNDANTNGFLLGLFTYSIPLTIINITCLIFVVINNLKAVGLASVFGFITSVIALILLSKIDVRASFGGAQSYTKLNLNYFAYVPAVLYFILMFNGLKRRNEIGINHLFKKGDSINRNEQHRVEIKKQNQLENKKHQRYDKKYLQSLRFEVFGIVIFFILLLYGVELYYTTGSSIFVYSLILVGIVVKTIIYHFDIKNILVKSSNQLVVFKIIFYVVTGVALVVYNFRLSFIENSIITTEESLLNFGFLILIAWIIYSVKEQKTAIKLFVNTNTLGNEPK